VLQRTFLGGSASLELLRYTLKSFIFFHSLRLNGNTVVEKRKKGGFTVKIGLKNLFTVLNTDFFWMRKKYLYTYAVLRAIDCNQNIKT